MDKDFPICQNVGLTSSSAIEDPHLDGGRGGRPLSFPQERLFLLDRIMPGLAAYNVPTLVRIPRRLDAERLRLAFQTVVERHHVLRTAVALHDGEPVGTVFAAPRFELAVLEDGEQSARREFAELANRHFDLGGDVLLRASLAHVGEAEDLLLVVFHHSGSDHASKRVLFAELDEIYLRAEQGREPELPELPVQYADHAQWQREQLTGPRHDELVEYWRERLAGAPDRLELPADHPRPGVQSYRGVMRELVIESTLAQPLREFGPRSARVTMFMALLAASTCCCTATPARRISSSAPRSRAANARRSRHCWAISPTPWRCAQTSRATRASANCWPACARRPRGPDPPGAAVREARGSAQPRAHAQSHSPVFQVLLGYDVAPTER